MSILFMEHKRCAYCRATDNLTIDHKHPKSLGGTDAKKNLQTLCSRCNGMKASIPYGQLKSIFKWHLLIMVEKDLRKRGLLK